MRCAKGGKPFLIMEEQAGKAGQSFFAPQPRPGELRLWAFQAVAHGAMGVNYFRWDSAKFGAEEYWHGLLNHDRSKSPAFDEIIKTVKELKALGPEILNSQYPADTALLFDYDSSWAIKIQPGHHENRGELAGHHKGIRLRLQNRLAAREAMDAESADFGSICLG